MAQMYIHKDLPEAGAKSKEEWIEIYKNDYETDEGVESFINELTPISIRQIPERRILGEKFKRY